MSFGFSPSDCVAVVRLAYNVVENSRKACGEHDQFTKEVRSLHIVLDRMRREAARPESLLNRNIDNRLDELRRITKDCRKILQLVNNQLLDYNDLHDKSQRPFHRVWKTFRFGNFEMAKLSDVRFRLCTYKESLTLYLNLIALGSQGRVERRMFEVGGEVSEIREELNWIIATMQASAENQGHEGSILTSYAEDDKLAWKQLRRELISCGFSVLTLKKHSDDIKAYMLELGQRGALDEPLLEKEVRDGEKYQVTESRAAIKDSSSAAPKRDTASKGHQPILEDDQESSTSTNSLVIEPRNTFPQTSPTEVTSTQHVPPDHTPQQKIDLETSTEPLVSGDDSSDSKGQYIGFPLTHAGSGTMNFLRENSNICGPLKSGQAWHPLSIGAEAEFFKEPWETCLIALLRLAFVLKSDSSKPNIEQQYPLRKQHRNSDERPSKAPDNWQKNKELYHSKGMQSPSTLVEYAVSSGENISHPYHHYNQCLERVIGEIIDTDVRKRLRIDIEANMFFERSIKNRTQIMSRDIYIRVHKLNEPVIRDGDTDRKKRHKLREKFYWDTVFELFKPVFESEAMTAKRQYSQRRDRVLEARRDVVSLYGEGKANDIFIRISCEHVDI